MRKIINLESGNLNTSGSSYSFNPWFWVSGVVTFILIVLLIWNLLHSYSTIKSFDRKELKLERASVELLYHVKSMEKSVRLGAATGDLSFKRNYEKHEEKLQTIFDEINKLVENKYVLGKIEKINKYKKQAEKIENKAFMLISYGKKKEATTLLKGWPYTKNQLFLTETTKEFTKILHRHVQKIVSLEKKFTLSSLIFVFIALVILIISWTITVKIWRRDFKKRKEKEEKIIYLNYHDALTKSYNRRLFMQAGQEEIKRAERYNKYFSLIMMDIDNFKKINDTYGHGAGDMVLKNFAGIIKKQVREVDIPARLGGDEFAVLLPETDIDVAEKVAGRIRQNIEDSKTLYKNDEIKVTVSVGVIDYRQQISDMDDLLHKADEALYRAKRIGRNCVVKNNENVNSEIY
ncbi:MAG: GGDEF domain-containing protein [Candidatus Mcinerneyibacterium aminivorans]|uniref:GGDEF domain-containing protein n=1 Tax=Candidatus Mcinerneyibacterium aminivorans TaxID=2703815 RepID=A0A5D0MLF0_9BACT|nr:MAG: GGDEF domain-containing protein [Candidatus Mcinerneyibacterium aminivorans]